MSSPTDDRVAAHDAMVRGIQMAETCGVHVHEEWVPQNRHHVWPLGMGGPDTPDNIVVLCENGHGAVHAYIDHLIRYGEAVPWDLRKHFGTKVRALALRGWTQAGKPRRARLDGHPDQA